MHQCPVCHNQELQVTKLICKHCDVQLSGQFTLPRLARLSPASQKLIEQFVLCGGNLKLMTEKLDTSYPTLRKKIDDLMQQLSLLQQQDQKKISHIMDNMEQGNINAEKGIRLIKEINGEL